LSDSDKDNKFKEELEKELETGLHNTSDDGGADDFTVKVRREEYIVKRRFYDKDKALEAAESLRKDKRNLVEDNIQGQALSSDEDVEDEKVDWDKLVDAGLVFDPPIAQAVEKKPGEAVLVVAQRVTKAVIDDKELEKTLVVRRPKVVPLSETDDEDEDGEFEDDETELDQDTSAAQKSRRLWLVLVLLVLALGGTLFYVMQQSPEKAALNSTDTRLDKAEPKDLGHKTTPLTPNAKNDEKQVSKTLDNQAKPVAAPKPKPPAMVTTLADNAPYHVEKTPPVSSKPDKINTDVTQHFTHTVHVSSYRDNKRSTTAVAQLKKKGFNAFSGVIRIPGKGDWYRVYAGYLTNLDEARTLANKIKKTLREDAVPRKTPWAIQVGDTVPLSQTKELISRLQKKGYSVNTVPVSKDNDVVRILAGAFMSESEASTMKSFLAKDGFSVKTVQR